MFDPAARTLSGTPTTIQAATAYTYTATDADGDTASRGFAIAVRESASATAPPLAPANFAATAGDARVTLTWDTANDASILRWEYWQREGTGDYGDWTAIAGSGPGTTAHAVESLVNGTAYTLQLRAVNAVGNGDSATASATPRVGNNPPTVQNRLADRRLTAGKTLVVDISATFDDHDDDELTYTATSGDPAAASVTLSAASLTLTGVAAGKATVTVTASDGTESASDAFAVTVQADTQPSLAAIADRTYTRGVEIDVLTLPLSSSGNGVLSYSLSPDPPAGLMFDPAARTLSGTPTTIQAATAYTYTATDADGDTASRGFAIAVRESASATAPPLAPANFAATAGDARVTLTWDTANDASILRWEYWQREGTGDYGDWTAIAGSGPGTTAHAVESLVNGTAYTLQLRAVNAVGNGDSATASATPRVGNNPPTVQNRLADRRLTAGKTLVVDISATFDDHDDDELTYTATSGDPAAASVTLSAASLTLTGVAAGKATVTVTASDGTESASDAFAVTVQADTQPSLAAIADRTYTRGVEIDVLTLPLSSSGNGVLSYSLSPDPPAGLMFDPAARTLSGTPTTIQAATAYTYTATDADGDTASRGFAIAVRESASATAPPLAPANFAATAGDARVTLTWDTANDASILRWEYWQREGTGDYGDWTAIAGSGPGTTAHAVESLVNGTAYTFQLRAVNAVGNGDSATASATPRVGNNPPTVQNRLADRRLTAGKTLVVDISATFDDHDDDELTYTATSGDPAAASVTLSAASLTLTGVAAGKATVTVTASDGTESASDAFAVTVQADTQPSLAAIADRTYTRGVEIDVLTLPLSSSGNGVLSYSLSPDPPAGLMFDPAARTLSGTPTTIQAATAYTYTATDADGDTASRGFAIAVRESASATAPPLAPANFAATAGDARVTLTWDTANDASILRWEYWQREGTGDYGDWTAIAGSGPGTTAHAVESLVNGTAYTFQLRAVNAVGNGDSATASATPRVGNNPPTVQNRLADRRLTAGKTLVVDISATFDDHDDDELTYTATSGDPAAASVTLSAASLTLTGVAAGKATVTVTASDGTESASDAFAVTVQADTQPSLAAIADRTYTRGVEIDVLTLPLSSSGNGVLSYSLSPDPPAGLMFDPAARTLSGTPTTIQAATAYTYTATDADGDTASRGFAIAVRESASATAPPLAPANFAATAGDARVTLTWDTANDASILRWEYWQREGTGDYGDWTAIAGSGPGTTAHAVESLVNGTAYTFQLRAVNAVGNGDSATASATPRVGNNPPTVQNRLADRRLTAGKTLVVDISATFDDHDDDELTYTATSGDPAAASVTLSAASLTLTGKAAGKATVTVTASDGTDSASDAFAVTVQADTQPSLAAIADRTYTRGVEIDVLTLPLSSSGNGVLSYSLSPDPPAGLMFDPAARTLSGTPTTIQAATAYTYTATDADGDTASRGFAIAVRESASATAPPLAPANFAATAGDARVTLTWDTANDASILRWEYWQREGTGDYGDWTAIAGSGPGTTAHAVESLVNGTAYTFQLRAVNAVGNGDSATASATPRVGNNPPTVQNRLADRRLTAGKTLVVDISATFDDHDDDELTYTATSGDPAAASVTLSAASLTLTGVAAGKATVTVTASDGTESASDAFAVTVQADTQPSLAAIADRTYTRGVEIDVLTLPLSSSGNGVLSYSLSPDPPPGLMFDPAARTLSGTPTTIQAATAYTYTATDADGDTAARRFGIEVQASVTTTPPLVEMKVSFGQATYTVMEGQQADIEVTMTPTADRRVDVPLAVALQGGATPEDFSRMPASLVFEEGESRRTISLEVTMDDVNDPGEGIVLIFDRMPEAVSAGEPASTEAHFEQRRMLEHFSQTLEGTLAVIARATAASAQTAIERRFERHRQRNRLETSVAELPSSPPASDHGAAALRLGESERMSRDGAGGRGAEGFAVPRAGSTTQTSATPGTGPNSENRETDTPGSWLRNVALGSLVNPVGSGQRDSGNFVGFSRKLGGNVDGQDPQYGSRIGAAAAGTEHASRLRDRELNLSEVSFAASLGRQEQETSWAPVLWAQGDLQQFNGDLAQLGMDYRGGLAAAHVGLDLYVNDRMLAGLSVMRSWADIEYTDDGTDGVLESRMDTVHPYLYWQPNERVDLWGIGGLGGGQVDVEEAARRHDFNADFRMLAGGVRAVLSRRGSNAWGLRADAFTAKVETDALEDIAQASGAAHRGRLMLEWVYERKLSVWRSLSLQAEAGGRFDGGDADRGAGVETGFRLGYLDTNRGLDVALHGRVLVVHESDYRDWGVGVQASWDPGEKQRGFRASVMSSWGQDGGGRTTLWDNADALMRPARMGAPGLGSQFRMGSEVAYAGIKAPGLPGVLTPYGRLRWSGHNRELAWGTSWSPVVDLPAMLELEAIRRENLTGPADLGVFLRASIPFGGSRDVIAGRADVTTQALDPKSIPRGNAESGADGPQATAAAVRPPAETVSAAQQDANPPPEPATPEPASAASQPPQASNQLQGVATPSITTAPAKGEARVVNVQPASPPRFAAALTQTAEMQALAIPSQPETRRQSTPAVTSSDGPAPMVVPSAGVVVQVGAFRNAEGAARITAELRQKGYAAITIDGSDYHRVVVGPFPGRSDAASAQSQLEQQGYQGYLRADLQHLLKLARSLSTAPALNH